MKSHVDAVEEEVGGDEGEGGEMLAVFRDSNIFFPSRATLLYFFL